MDSLLSDFAGAATFLPVSPHNDHLMAPHIGCGILESLPVLFKNYYEQCLSQDLETGCLKLAVVKCVSKFLRGITIYSYFNHKHVNSSK